MLNHKKGFAPLLILVLIFVLVGAYFAVKTFNASKNSNQGSSAGTTSTSPNIDNSNSGETSSGDPSLLVGTWKEEKRYQFNGGWMNQLYGKAIPKGWVEIPILVNASPLAANENAYFYSDGKNFCLGKGLAGKPFVCNKYFLDPYSINNGQIIYAGSPLYKWSVTDNTLELFTLTATPGTGVRDIYSRVR